ncbi:MAG: DUF1799 domain-containing protein [Zoogloeaceae bacterium]|nr:DUF1799 domain-containing protein [Zoogloeaceae bacterium]
MLVYEHNWLAFAVWCDVWNQWRWCSGMVPMRAGLDWGQVEAVMRLRGVPRRERCGLMKALRIMENEALGVMAAQARRRV